MNSKSATLLTMVRIFGTRFAELAK